MVPGSVGPILTRVVRTGARVLLALAVVVATLELAARVMVARGVLPNRMPADLFISHAIGWTLEPDLRVRIFTVNGLVDIETNQLGFRDRAYAPTAPAGVKRLVILGDSFTLALETRQSDTFHVLLEERCGGAAEVIALASSGYETQQELLAYQMIGQTLEPDIVLLMFYVGNDIIGNSHKARAHLPHYSLNEQGILELHKYPYTGDFDLPLVNSQRSTPLMRHSMLAFLVGNIARGMRQDRVLTSGRCAYQSAENFPQPQPEDWLLTQALLLALRDAVEATGAQLRVAIIPTEFQVEQALLQDYLATCEEPAVDTEAVLQVPLRDFLDTQQIAYLDLLPILREARASAATTLYHTGLDIHWTVAGHKVVADALWQWLHPVLN